MQKREITTRSGKTIEVSNYGTLPMAEVSTKVKNDKGEIVSNPNGVITGLGAFQAGKLDKSDPTSRGWFSEHTGDRMPNETYFEMGGKTYRALIKISAVAKDGDTEGVITCFLGKTGTAHFLERLSLNSCKSEEDLIKRATTEFPKFYKEFLNKKRLTVDSYVNEEGIEVFNVRLLPNEPFKYDEKFADLYNVNASEDIVTNVNTAVSLDDDEIINENSTDIEEFREALINAIYVTEQVAVRGN